MSIAIRNTVRTAKEFTRWAARAERGQPVTYHIGNLGRDRAESPALHLLAETVMIFAEKGYIATSQVIMRLPMGSATWYYATRTGSGRAPRSIMFDQADAFAYRALEAMRDRDASLSAGRAIREHMGCTDQLALDFLALLWARGWVEPSGGKGYRLSDEGRRMLS